MLKIWQQNTLIGALLALAAFQFVLWCALTPKPSPQSDYSANTSAEQKAESLLLCIPAEGWTAIFTGALTVSTIGLWFATRNAVRVQMEDTRILQRAYITVEPAGFESVTSGAQIARIKIVNSGNLPARKVRWMIHGAENARGWRSRDPEKPQDNDGTNILAPKGEMIRFQDLSIPIIAIEKIEKEELWLFIWGIVCYEDGFGNERYTKFCHRYDKHSFMSDQHGKKPRAGLQHQYGNGTDEDDQQNG